MKAIRLPIIIIVFILWQTFAPAKTFAWLDCPYQKINDTYPGWCSLYLDTNNNQVCDRSEPEAGKNVQGVATKAPQRTTAISFWFLFLPSTSYFLHWFFVSKTNLKKKSGLFSPAGFKYFWNVILLLLFIPSGISGLLLGLGVKNQTLLFWHNNLGASFVVIALTHLLTHLNYYLKPPKSKIQT